MADASSPSPATTPSTPRRRGSNTGLAVLRRQSSRDQHINLILETGLARAESISRSESVSRSLSRSQSRTQTQPQPPPGEQQQEQQPRMEPLLRSASQPGRISENDDEDADATGSAARMQPPNYHSTTVRSRRVPNSSSEQQPAPQPSGTANGPASGGARGGIFSRLKKTLASFGSIELDNKGSVARDHLALERTFLAWLRTSVSFASIGIAVTQLFRLNTTLNGGSGGSSGGTSDELRRLGKPLGAAFLGISILILMLGYSRYVRGQKWVMTGRFPASRGTVVLVTLLTFAVMVASLAIVLVFSPGTSGG